ncbi:MAG: SDR family NAD(P)-dependent oxidoreductase [Archangium sp.]|nr:SDR family NAD(P)-dependent oxidoreductase [Archangium sp.]
MVPNLPESSSLNFRPLALLTGASSELGVELAAQLVASGHDLILVGDDAEALMLTAQALRDLGGCPMIETIEADLALPGEAQRVYQLAADVGYVEVLVINPGERLVTRSRPRAGERSRLQLQVTSPVVLASLFGTDMAWRGRGKILFSVESTPHASASVMTAAGAARALTLAFSAELQRELEDSGVTVSVVQPPSTDELTAAAKAAGFEALFREDSSSLALQ